MLTALLDGAKRTLRRPQLLKRNTQAFDTPVAPLRPHDLTRSQSWHFYDRNVDDDDGEDGGNFIQDDAEDDGPGPEDDDDDDDDDDDEEEEELEEHVPLLPIFESSQLDSLPIYNLTHTIRLLIVQKCETTLSWDQLRSPQISQFMVKPIQKDILDSHFSRATIYALLANCLQFTKEADANPAIVGVSKTRAMVCELLAVRLLKEYSTRELIDVLSYDFYPLTGISDAPRNQHQRRPQAARTSTLEVAIRASAKRFLAHPLVVQQLEAIWAGTIVFHHAADAAHRRVPQIPRMQQYGTMNTGTTAGLMNSGTINSGTTPGLFHQSHAERKDTAAYLATRRTVTLYDPRDASLFKLSRLRVPRYRHFMSTCSLAVFLGLFVAVLTERSLEITALELVFWFWSAGFMLDEVVGFNEQGFSLYILSIWNAFDFGILLLLICFYALRLYGILLLDVHKRQVADFAFDVLAANAILLFPRLFSILDHYRYFSQLLIAFRMMAQDLAAVLFLIIISCSGFFVAFTLSFGNEGDPGQVAYGLFQLLMGFTPTAWALWDEYNILGKALLVLFLFITHFLVVTILVTVLTNSFMAIVQNANDEHQFVFAVNTISMVKSDALFSYIAPSNILGWVLTPVRYIIPFRRFVWVNRTVIKATHFPVLLFIFVYERTILRSAAYEPTELIQRGRRVHRLKSANSVMFFSPREPKLREPSAATFHKDRALAEVFKQPYNDDTYRKPSGDRNKRSSVAVDTWMRGMGPDGTVSPPAEDDRAIVDQLERPRGLKKSWTKSWTKRFASGISMGTRSLIASDPEDFGGNEYPFPLSKRLMKSTSRSGDHNELSDQDDHDGDDELLTNDDGDEQATVDGVSAGQKDGAADTPTQAAMTPGGLPSRPSLMQRHSSISFADSSPVRHTPQIRRPPFSRSSFSRPATSRKIPGHKREVSVQTVLFNPSNDEDNTTPPGNAKQPVSESIPTSSDVAASISPTNKQKGKARQAKPREDKTPMATPPRPIMPTRGAAQSTPNVHHLHDPPSTVRRNNPTDSTFTPSVAASSVPLHQQPPQHRQVSAFHASYPRREPSMGFDLASDLGDNKATNGGAAGVPASFATQMAFADRLRRMKSAERREEREDDERRMGKLVLARMNVLEEGFREMLKEVKGIRGSDAGSNNGNLGKKKRGSKVGSSSGSGGTTPGLRSGLATPALRSGMATPRNTMRRDRNSDPTNLPSQMQALDQLQSGSLIASDIGREIQSAGPVAERKFWVEEDLKEEEWEDDPPTSGLRFDGGRGSSV